MISFHRRVTTGGQGRVTTAEEKSSLMNDNSDTTNQNTQSDNLSDEETKQNLIPTSISNENAFINAEEAARNGSPANIREADMNVDGDKVNGSSLSEKQGLFSAEKSDSRKNSATGISPRKGSVGQRSHHGSSWSVGHRSEAHHGSMLSVTSGLEPAVAGVGLIDQNDGGRKDSGWKSCCCVTILRRIFDPYLFRYVPVSSLLLSCH